MELNAKAPLENTKTFKGKYLCYVIVLTNHVIVRHGVECNNANIPDLIEIPKVGREYNVDEIKRVGIHQG